MNVKVGTHTITIDVTTDINAGEYNVTPVHFEFSEEYDGLTKMAVFTSCGTSVKTSILNNQCTIPFEVLEQPGIVSLGVYGYETENEELELRYSPKSQNFNVKIGSYREGNDPDLPEPSEWEQVLELINEAIEETNNLNLVADKEGNVTKITITKKDGTSYDVEVLDGVSLENIAINNRNLLVTYGGETTNLGQIVPNIQVGTTTTGSPGTTASVINVGTDLNPIFEFTIPRGEAGAIKMQIVDTLPQTGEEDTIYLVPLEHPDIQGNNYAEYIYINGAWELLGKVGVQVDLTDYYTKSETNNLLDTKQPLIDNDHKLPYSLISGTPTIPTKTSQLTNDSNFVSNTDYATSQVGGVIKIGVYGTSLDTNKVFRANSLDYATYGNQGNNLFISKGTLENVITGKDLTTKAYVDSLVGDINTALDTINGEVI